ncbi:MAG: (2Fe-2S)-binding protein [Candidatus Marinimicrobia bacterium]|nr:(2Fe-2S)-binding protein [Candidatus Neomarinimicrobiota bacterium]
MIGFYLNGKPVFGEFNPGTTLFDYLRDQEIFSVKFGSEKGETGADSVLLDGKVMNSSLLLMHTIDGKVIETIESFSQGVDVHPLQEAFIEEGAVQCGYCTPSMILAAESLLRENPTPNDDYVRESLSGVYCRCTGFVKPIQAIMKYATSREDR